MKQASRISVALVALAIVSLSVATGAALAKPAKLCIPERSGAKVVSDSSQGTCKAGYRYAELGKEGEPTSPSEEGICIPLAVSKPVVTPNSLDECPARYTFVATGATLGGSEGKEGKQGLEGKEGKEGPEGKSGLSANELTVLKSILPDIKFVSSGVGGKPTIQFSGVNLQILNGDGSTNSTNGAGNLVIGYDAFPEKQTGSHNLVLGGGQEFTSYAGILGGAENSLTGPYSSILAGAENHASAFFTAVVGGEGNSATEQAATVLGGGSNLASGENATVLSGFSNTASGGDASVGSGERNTASGSGSSVSGCAHNTAEGENSSILGGSGISLTSLDAVSP
jgi:hypothetical protein